MYSGKSNRFAQFGTSLLFLVLLTATAARADSPSAQEIDAAVAAALTEFSKDVDHADEYLKGAKGVLVVPDVKKVGFVLAAQWGTGALQVGGKTVDYYRMDAGSAGFQAGYQSTNMVFIFFTDTAVQKFRDSEGWTVGAEAGLTFVEVGTGVRPDTLKGKGDVAGFAFGTEGLMAGWSAKGSKFSRINPGE